MTMDPKSIVESLNKDWNAHDTEKVVSYFADNGVIRTLPTPPVSIKSVWEGKDQILGFVQAHMPGFKVEATDLKADGTKASWNFKAWSETFARMGVSPSSGMAEASLNSEGKIELFTINFDNETVAKMQASLASQPQ